MDLVIVGVVVLGLVAIGAYLEAKFGAKELAKAKEELASLKAAASKLEKL